MKFKKGDHVICEVKKFNFGWTSVNEITYDIEIKKGIISGTTLSGNYGFMYLVKCNNGDQNYFYEDNITLDLIKIREDKLNELGI
jgi:hypothetical protein